MLLHISVTCCLVAAVTLAAPQGYGAPTGYGGANRNSVVQGSALPRRFSVSKGSQGKGYLPPSAYATARPMYQSGGNGYQSSAGSQYQGSSASQYTSGSGGYQGGSASQYQSSSGSSGYSGGAGQYSSGGNQYSKGGSQYTTEDPYAEPANYDFSYEVNAPEYMVMFGHQESRKDMLARGSYKVLLPDGRTQLVEYEADQEGYRPTITYQEAAGGAGGYQAGGNGGYSQGGYQSGASQGGRGNGGYSQNGGGYSQNGNGYSKRTSGGKASYGQKSYSGNQNNGGYQGAGKGQGYRY